MTKVAEHHRPAARRPGLHRAGGPPLSHRLQRGPTSRRPQSLEPARPVRTLLQRQDPRPARDPCQHRRPAVEHAPSLRPMATITHDTLDWYGFDEDGAGVHDVIGTRCDPYTNLLLSGGEYHHCCHSNLAGALAAERNITPQEAEAHIHDVLNVFMCTGFTRDTHQYFMKASPVRPRRLHRVLRRDRSSRRSFRMPGRRLRREPLERRRPVLPARRSKSFDRPRVR